MGTVIAHEAVPVVGVSMTANIGSDRQIVLQGHYARGDAAEGDALLAELNLRIDVLKAPSELEKLETELREQEEGLKRQLHNLELLDKNAQREQAERVVAVQAAEQAVEEANERANKDWYARGKAGDYREGPRIQQMRDNVARLRAEAEAKAAKDESELALAAEQARINQGRFEFAISETKLKIAKVRALLPAANDGS
jgi:uncharacterized protein YifE (UPF0438 family)